MHQADKIAPGPNGRTSYRLPAPLGAGYTYYWRTRAADGANSGPYSAVSTFTVVLPVVIDAPVAVAPSGRLNTNKPDFRVTNGAISGTIGVGYRFEVSQDRRLQPDRRRRDRARERQRQHHRCRSARCPTSTTFYWRVKGSDGSKESGYSNTLTFTTRDAPAPPPTPTPGPADPVHVDSAAWTTAQWKTWFLALAAQKGGSTVSEAGLRAMRADLLSHGSDFQNGWRGDMRPRLFLPVPGCPIANRPDVPLCSYDRTVDLGSYGGPWEWLPRF